MKNSADLGECYPPRPSPSVDNTLLDLQNSSYPTQPHSIIAKYSTFLVLGLHPQNVFFLQKEEVMPLQRAVIHFLVKILIKHL